MSAKSNAEEAPAGPDMALAYYRVKADLCQQLAGQAADPAIRDQWLRLANQWTTLMLHANQKAIEPAAPVQAWRKLLEP